MSAPLKDYLGDSVYAAWDGENVTLTTENGVGVSNEIILEPAVVRALGRFLARAGVAMEGEPR